MVAQLVGGGMIVALHLIGQRQVGGIENACFGPEELEQPRRFFDREARERAFAERASEQQDARRRIVRAKSQRRARMGIAEIKRGQMIRVGQLTNTGQAVAPFSYQPRVRFTIAITDSITGTSTSTPTIVASAAPDFRPNSEIAEATASSQEYLPSAPRAGRRDAR